MIPGADLRREGLVHLTRDLKADLPADGCLLAVETDEQVKGDIAVARAAHVDGTPAFFLNNLRVLSVQALVGEVEKLIGSREAREIP